MIKGTKLPSTLYERLNAGIRKEYGVDPCWIWTKGTSGWGYGDIREGPKTLKAHRVAWEQKYGPIPNGLFVLHKCNNPPCCNPDHLFLGTKKDNSLDMARKKRSAAQVHPETVARGEKQHSAKLTERSIKEIRRRYASGTETTYSLASEFKVSQVTISCVIRRKTWRHVA